MGIKHLNRFFKENARESTKFITLSELSGKKIAVDISIYIYKYATDGTLVENIYLMLALFRHYNVIPIFVFDGKPPIEKKELLAKRRKDKKEAEDEYNRLKYELTNNLTIDQDERQDIINNMDMLKSQFVHINKNDIENIKQLIKSYGASYYVAEGEADVLCALLTIKGNVWACLSEDMDMFVYGCPRVIRYISLLNHTAVIYDMKGILENLGISQKELREICVLSGTDYSNSKNEQDATLHTTLKYFKKFRKKANNKNDFYSWLIENTNYIADIEHLKNIYKMFDLNSEEHNLNDYKNIEVTNGTIMKGVLKQILKTDGFIFLNN